MLLGNTLFINANHPEATGAAVISDRNYLMIKENSQSAQRIRIDIALKDIRSNWISLFFKFNLVSNVDLERISEIVSSKEINTIFLDNSMFGNFAANLKTQYPSIRIITFFHNVEQSYFRELIKVSKKLYHYFTLALVRRAEKQAACYSNFTITLNRRDADEIKHLYNRQVELILPTSFVDDYQIEQSNPPSTDDKLILLFVGSYFPPNIFGIEWFIEKVMPIVKRNIVVFVVGNGFELHKPKKATRAVNFIGKVDSIQQFYNKADLVIAPIFHGSGMKTKVAEALMYNRPIIGTNESFEGYDVNISQIGFRCNTPAEFANAIESFQRDKLSGIRDVFLKNYTFEATLEKFTNFLKAGYE
ncbi:glycosyltransferase [Pedobacter rhizosphaerae]|uniref:Glycosyl transferases group 1 n=1 Tax=Pedobacter rhizosphaerae TaxID=390241 RepID=A0A1H9U3C8_9SPHI|nr:glycosyltransferase [Pedobacter rhizosphaerae]SES03946.1 Glycosyl transferases group 1 [Pedobacter rhizosphaerae]